MVPKDLFLIAVAYDVEENPFVKMGGEFFPDGQTGEGFDDVHQLLMAVNMQAAFISSFVHAGGDHPDHPDHSKDVVVVGMGDKDMMDPLQRDLLIFQGQQDPVASAGIGQKIFFAFFHGETGVVAVNGLGISRAEYDQFFHLQVPRISEFIMMYFIIYEIRSGFKWQLSGSVGRSQPTGIRCGVPGRRNMDDGRICENIVCIEFLRCDIAEG